MRGRYGEKPAPDSHFVFSPDANRQIGLYATSSIRVLGIRARLVVLYSCCMYTAARVHASSGLVANQCSRARTGIVGTFEGYVRFQPPTSRQIVAQLIDRPTGALGKTLNLLLLSFISFFPPLFLLLFFFPTSFFCRMRDKPIHIRTKALKKEKEERKERGRRGEREREIVIYYAF